MSVLLYGEALLEPGGDVVVRAQDGTVEVLPVARWVAPVDAVDQRTVARLSGPTLDIGCGPGRIVAAVAARGIPVLGIDIAPAAVTMTRQRGGSALVRDVFGRVPAVGRWRSALLLDGNIGIGGDPTRLLRRTAELLQRGGHLIAEVEAPGSRCRTAHVRLERGQSTGRWFPWSWLSADCVAEVSHGCGFQLHDLWPDEGRCFAELVRA